MGEDGRGRRGRGDGLRVARGGGDDDGGKRRDLGCGVAVLAVDCGVAVVDAACVLQLASAGFGVLRSLAVEVFPAAGGGSVIAGVGPDESAKAAARMPRVTRGESARRRRKSFPVERLSDLHGDLLSVGNAARQGRAFLFPQRENAGIKKPSIFRRGRRRRQDGPTNRRRRDSTPILSVARQSPGPHSPGLDERKKAGLLTSGSSYSLRLTARFRTVASWSFRRPLQRRYRTGFTPVSLFSSRHCGRHFLAGWSRRGGTISKNWKRE